MFNRLYHYFDENILILKKKFGFRVRDSTDHAVLVLIDGITQAFNNREHFLAIFVDLSKAFDTADQVILPNKLCFLCNKRQR